MEVKRYNANARAYSASSVKAFLDTFESDVFTSEVSGNNLLVHVKDIYDIICNFDSGVMQVEYEEIVSLSQINTWNSLTLTVIADSDFFYFQWCCNYGSGRRMIAVYEKDTSGNDYIGWIGCGTGNNDSAAWYALSSVTLTNLTDELYYNHGDRLNYTCELDSIDWCEDCLFSGGYKVSNMPKDTIACSIITGDKVVTFAGKNYYSVASNILVPMD